MYRSGPTAEELKAFGLLPEDVIDRSDQPVWEENWDAYLVFSRVVTQWRSGMGGFTGLDHSVILMPGGYFDLLGIPKKKRASVMDDLLVMEIEALDVMRPKT